MKHIIDDVQTFMRVGGQDTPSTLQRSLPEAVRTLRRRLIAEEAGELTHAIDNNDLPGIADGIADLIYVAVGAALAYGIPLEKVWAEVQRSNMSKYQCPGWHLGQWVSNGNGEWRIYWESLSGERSLAAIAAGSGWRAWLPGDDKLFAEGHPLIPEGIAVRLIQAYVCPQCNGSGYVALRDEGGKVVKPPGWTPPDIDGILRDA